MHALAKLLLELFKLGSRALANRFASHRESSQSVLPTNMLEAQKIERIGFSFSSTVLESRDAIIGISDDDHLALRPDAPDRIRQVCRREPEMLKTINESSEPVVGRLGIALRRTQLWFRPLSG